MQGYILIVIIGLSLNSIECEEFGAPTLGPYNIEARVVFTTPDHDEEYNTSFGYSLMFRQAKMTRQLIVGAPTARSKSGTREGLLYKCDFPDNPAENIHGEVVQICDPIHFTHTANRDGDQDNIGLNTDDMWLGASVAGTDNSENPLVVCAPRWKRIITINAEEGTKNETTNGICYVLDDSMHNIYDKPIEVVPYFDHDSATILEKNVVNIEAGWSSHVVPDKPDSILIGAPEYDHGKGMALYYHNATSPPMELKCRFCEEKKTSHFGFSIASGIFNIDARLENYFAISAPAAYGGTGIVLFFRQHFLHTQLKWFLEGDKCPGENFGYSLAVIRKSRERRLTNDLAVGAPFYKSDSVQHGRVYVFTSLLFLKQGDATTLFQRVDTLEDKTEVGSMFGAAIVDLGDLDDDDKPEIGVGAPYAAAGNGAFYVFSRDGEEYHCIQKVSFAGFRGFGSSLASIRFGDKPCQDVAIGVLRSYKSVLLPCHVRTYFDLSVQAMTKDVNSANLNFTINFKLTAPYWKKMFSIVTVLHITVEAKYKNEIVKIRSPKTGTLLGIYKEDTELRQFTNKTKQHSFELTFVPEKMEYTENIIITFRYEMKKDPSSDYTYKKENARVTPMSIPPKTLWLGCEDENCQPNLSLTLEEPNPEYEYVRGRRNKSERALVLVAHVNNSGEAAYNAWLHVEVGAELTVDPPQRCQMIENKVLKCKLHSPVWKNEGESIKLQFHDVSTKMWDSSPVVARLVCPTCRDEKELKQEARLYARELKPNLTLTLELHDSQGNKVYLIDNRKTNNLVLVARVSNSGEDAHNAWMRVGVRMPSELSLNASEGCERKAGVVECKIRSPFMPNEDQVFKLGLWVIAGLGAGVNEVVLNGTLGCDTCGAATETNVFLQIQPDHGLNINMALYDMHAKVIKKNECRIELFHHYLLSKKPFLVYSYQIFNRMSTPWNGLGFQFSVMSELSPKISQSSRIKGSTEKWHDGEACKTNSSPSVDPSRRMCQFDLEAGEMIEVNFTSTMEPGFFYKTLQNGLDSELVTKAILEVPNFVSNSYETILSVCLVREGSADSTPQIPSSTVFHASVTSLLAIFLIFVLATSWVLCRRSRKARRSLLNTYYVKTGSTDRLYTPITLPSATEEKDKHVRWNEQKEECKYNGARKYSFLNPMLENEEDENIGNSDNNREEPKNTDRLLVEFADISVDMDSDEISEQLQEQMPLTPSPLTKNNTFDL